MVVFLKPNSAITNTLRASLDEPLHYESEICLLYWDGKFVAAGFGFDLTKRALQTELKNKGLPWERAKAFDGSALFSDFVTIDANDEKLGVELFVDEALTQQGRVEQMFFKPAAIFNELAEFISLNNGDIVMTGTPKGVGKVVKGANYRGRLFNDSGEIVQVQWQAQ